MVSYHLCRTSLRAIVLVLLAGLPLSSLAQAKRPNILFILSYQIRNMAFNSHR